MKEDKASSKLKNVQAVRDMLDGTHKSQSKKVFAFGKMAEPAKKRTVGEKWVDEDEFTWEQMEGYKLKHGKLQDVRDSLFYKNKACPVCGVSMVKRLDEKFYNMKGKCLDCVIAEEHQMKLDGTFEKYEKEKMLANFESWLKDAQKEVEVLKEASMDYVNSDGTIEKWKGGLTPDQIQDQFDKFQKSMRKKFGIDDILG